MPPNKPDKHIQEQHTTSQRRPRTACNMQHAPRNMRHAACAEPRMQIRGADARRRAHAARAVDSQAHLALVRRRHPHTRTLTRAHMEPCSASPGGIMVASAVLPDCVVWDINCCLRPGLAFGGRGERRNLRHAALLVCSERRRTARMPRHRGSANHSVSPTPRSGDGPDRFDGACCALVTNSGSAKQDSHALTVHGAVTVVSLVLEIA